MILYLDPPGLMEQHMFGAVTITIAVSAAGVYLTIHRYTLKIPCPVRIYILK